MTLPAVPKAAFSETFEVALKGIEISYIVQALRKAAKIPDTGWGNRKVWDDLAYRLERLTQGCQHLRPSYGWGFLMFGSMRVVAYADSVSV